VADLPTAKLGRLDQEERPDVICDRPEHVG